MWEYRFAGNSQIEITGESGSFDDSIEMIKAKRPDIVLLDINLDNASGMDAVPLIRKFSPGTRIIAVSMHRQPAYAKKMLQLGAKAYITKNSPFDEVSKAIETVMAGGIYVCAEMKDILADHLASDETAVHNIKGLSMREIEMVKHIKNGRSSKQISSDLKISIRTVEVHRHNILKKLKLKNTASLINFINTTDLNFD